MTPLQREALQMCLEYIETDAHERRHVRWKIDEALAEQPAQQEPVVFYRCNGCGHAYEQVHPTSCDCMEGSSFEKVNYYTSPQPAQAFLASAQIVSLNDMQGVVDWLPHNGAPLKAGDYLYTSPQPAQRKPLTDDELDKCMRQSKLSIAPAVSFRIGFRAAEAAHRIKENT